MTSLKRFDDRGFEGRDEIENLATAWANLHLVEEDEGGIDQLKQEDVDNASSEGKDLRFCLVSRFFTDKSINFIAMKNTLAAVWEPGKGINETELGGGRLRQCSIRGHGRSINIFG